MEGEGKKRKKGEGRQGEGREGSLRHGFGGWTPLALVVYVAPKATYIRLLHGKIGFLGGAFRP